MSNSVGKQIQVTVEKNIPIPEGRKERSQEKGLRINWPFEEMEHGDSFLLPIGCEKKKAYSALSALKRRKKVSDNNTLLIREEGSQFRVWLIKK